METKQKEKTKTKKAGKYSYYAFHGFPDEKSYRKYERNKIITNITMALLFIPLLGFFPLSIYYCFDVVIETDAYRFKIIAISFWLSTATVILGYFILSYVDRKKNFHSEIVDLFQTIKSIPFLYMILIFMYGIIITGTVLRIFGVFPL